MTPLYFNSLSKPLDLSFHELNNINLEINQLSKYNKIEKFLIRKAFDKKNILPDFILWAQKQAFSDGVGYSWKQSINKWAETEVKKIEIKKYEINSPKTNEEFVYRNIFS